MNIKKILLIVSIVILIFPPLPTWGQTEGEKGGISQAIDSQLEVLDVREIEKLINQIDDEINRFIPQFSLNKVIDDLKTEK